jgi:hypothetical protein
MVPDLALEFIAARAIAVGRMDSAHTLAAASLEQPGWRNDEKDRVSATFDKGRMARCTF